MQLSIANVSLVGTAEVGYPDVGTDQASLCDADMQTDDPTSFDAYKPFDWTTALAVSKCAFSLVLC